MRPNPIVVVVFVFSIAACYCGVIDKILLENHKNRRTRTTPGQSEGAVNYGGTPEVDEHIPGSSPSVHNRTETPLEPPSVKRKRCPSTQQTLRAALNPIGDDMVGAMTPVVVARRDLQAQLKRRLCDNCKAKPQCNVHKKCEQCNVWCNNEEVSPNAITNDFRETNDVPETIINNDGPKVSLTNRFSDTNQSSTDDVVSLSTSNGFKRVFTVASFSSGSIKKLICKLLGIQNTSDIDNMVVWVTTFSNQPPKFADDYNGNVSPQVEELSEILNQELRKAADMNMMRGRDFLTNRQMERIAEKVLADSSNDINRVGEPKGADDGSKIVGVSNRNNHFSTASRIGTDNINESQDNINELTGASTGQKEGTRNRDSLITSPNLPDPEDDDEATSIKKLALSRLQMSKLGREMLRQNIRGMKKITTSPKLGAMKEDESAEDSSSEENEDDMNNNSELEPMKDPKEMPSEPTETPHQEPSISPSSLPHNEGENTENKNSALEPIKDPKEIPSEPTETPHQEPSISPSSLPHLEGENTDDATGQSGIDKEEEGKLGTKTISQKTKGNKETTTLGVKKDLSEDSQEDDIEMNKSSVSQEDAPKQIQAVDSKSDSSKFSKLSQKLGINRMSKLKQAVKGTEQILSSSKLGAHNEEDSEQNSSSQEDDEDMDQTIVPEQHEVAPSESEIPVEVENNDPITEPSDLPQPKEDGSQVPSTMVEMDKLGTKKRKYKGKQPTTSKGGYTYPVLSKVLASEDAEMTNHPAAKQSAVDKSDTIGSPEASETENDSEIHPTSNKKVPNLFITKNLLDRLKNIMQQRMTKAKVKSEEFEIVDIKNVQTPEKNPTEETLGMKKIKVDSEDDLDDTKLKSSQIGQQLTHSETSDKSDSSLPSIQSSEQDEQSMTVDSTPKIKPLTRDQFKAFGSKKLGATKILSRVRPDGDILRTINEERNMRIKEGGSNPENVMIGSPEPENGGSEEAVASPNQFEDTFSGIVNKLKAGSQQFASAIIHDFDSAKDALKNVENMVGEIRKDVDIKPDMSESGQPPIGISSFSPARTDGQKDIVQPQFLEENGADDQLLRKTEDDDSPSTDLEPENVPSLKQRLLSKIQRPLSTTKAITTPKIVTSRLGKPLGVLNDKEKMEQSTLQTQEELLETVEPALGLPKEERDSFTPLRTDSQRGLLQPQILRQNVDDGELLRQTEDDSPSTALETENVPSLKQSLLTQIQKQLSTKAIATPRIITSRLGKPQDVLKLTVKEKTDESATQTEEESSGRVGPPLDTPKEGSDSFGPSRIDRQKGIVQSELYEQNIDDDELLRKTEEESPSTALETENVPSLKQLLLSKIQKPMTTPKIVTGRLGKPLRLLKLNDKEKVEQSALKTEDQSSETVGSQPVEPVAWDEHLTPPIFQSISQRRNKDGTKFSSPIVGRVQPPGTADGKSFSIAEERVLGQTPVETDDNFGDINDVSGNNQLLGSSNTPFLGNHGEFSTIRNNTSSQAWSSSLGKIIPVNQNYSLASLKPNDLYFIGNGIKLPLKMVRKNDGALHLSVDLDKLCACRNNTCPKNHTAVEQAVDTILEEADMNEPEDMTVGMSAPRFIENSLGETSGVVTKPNERQTEGRWLNMKNSIAKKLDPTEENLPLEDINVFKRSSAKSPITHNPPEKISIPFEKQTLQVTSEVDNSLHNHGQGSSEKFQEFLNKKLAELKSKMMDIERKNDLKAKQLQLSQDELIDTLNTITKNVDTTTDDVESQTIKYVIKQKPLNKMKTKDAYPSKSLITPKELTSRFKEVLERQKKGNELLDIKFPIKDSYKITKSDRLDNKLGKLNEYVDEYAKEKEKLLTNEAETLLKTQKTSFIKKEVDIMNNILKFLKTLAEDKK